MNLKSRTLDERALDITEYDVINCQEVLILTVYCIRRDNEVWELPQPQIYNMEVYLNNKKAYDEAILSFREDCQNLSKDQTSLIQGQVNTIKKDSAILEDCFLDNDYRLLNLEIDLGRIV